MYCFSYQGELVQGADRTKVIVNLARLFSISEKQAAQLFDADKEFFRDGLDKSTAQDYVITFSRIGARGYARKSTPKDSTNVSTKSLAERLAENRKVNSSVEVSGEQQGDRKKSKGDTASKSKRATRTRSDDDETIKTTKLPRLDPQVEYGADVMKHLKAEKGKRG